MFEVLKRIINKISVINNKTCMEKEILEQPYIIDKLIRKYIGINFCINMEIPDNINGIVFIASGSSYHSASIISEFINKTIPFFAHSYYASEIANFNSFDTDKNILYVFISQSGETSDTKKALSLISSKTENTLCVTNTKNSSIYNNSKYKILTYAGVEKAIASTKAMSAQTFCLFLLALKFFDLKGINTAKYKTDLLNVSKSLKEFLENIGDDIKNFAKIMSVSENIILLANSIYYRLAQEGALKIQEISYINSSAYPLGEFLHGHMAVLNKKSCVISIVNQDNRNLADIVHSKLNDKFKYESLSITNINDYKDNHRIFIKETDEISFIFASLIALQLLALYVSIQLKHSTDNPDGLTKVVV